MSKVLEEAIAKLAELPEEDQDSIASWLLEDLESERRWEAIFSESGSALARLADEALNEHASGFTKELDPDKL